MKLLKSLTVLTAISLASGAASEETELDTAIKNGGERLTSEQIAELIVDNVVTARSGEKMFRFYYNPDNVVDGELTNGGWQGSGAFAITDTDNVCVSMAADKGRYRCLIVVRNGDAVHKFKSKGKMTFELLKVEPSTGL